MDEANIEKLLNQDLATGTDAFREGLLSRCLDELESDEYSRELDDSELELLAAAGSAHMNTFNGAGQTPNSQFLRGGANNLLL